VGKDVLKALRMTPEVTKVRSSTTRHSQNHVTCAPGRLPRVVSS
jgi:hypothetical protein